MTKWDFSCHLSTFGADSLLFLFSSYALCTLSCGYGMCTGVWLSTYSHKCIHVFLSYSGYSKQRKEHFGHKAAAGCAPAMQSLPSVLSRCLTFDILQSQAITASRADKRAVFTAHFTSLFKWQMDFFVMQTSVPVGTKPTLPKLFLPDYRGAIRW